MKKFRGTFTVLVTPFTKNDELDEEGLRNNIDWLIEQGIHGIDTSGSTAECAQLSEDERKEEIKITVDQVNGRVPVLAGTGGASTKETIKWTKYAKDVGADGAMIINPWYCLPNAEESFNHFKSVAETVDIPIMLYNNPDMSGVDMKSDLVVKLAEIDNISYIKESSSDILRVRDIIQLAGDKMAVFCGSDNWQFQTFVVGAKGWVSGMSHVVPKLASNLFELVDKKDIDGARKVYFKLAPLSRFMDFPNWVQRIKAALNMMGKAAGAPRKPRLPIKKEERACLQKILKDLRILPT